MNVFDKFLNSISYKFAKGYPDMDNKQDVLIIESELRQLGVEAKIAQPAKNSNPEINNILQTLQKAGSNKFALSQVGEILEKYTPEQLKIFTDNFRKYTVNDLDKIWSIFSSDFFEVKARQGEGRGEVMLLIGLKDSKSGGTATKDIMIDGKVYEVKELSDGLIKLGADGEIAGSSYLKNLMNFTPLFTKEVANSLDLTEEEEQIVNAIINYYPKLDRGNGSKGFLNFLKRTCEILKEKLSTQKETPVKYISAGGKKITLSDDDYNKLLPQAGTVNIDLGDELEDTRIKINKLKRHPWVENPNLIMDELNQKYDSFLKNIDYLIIYDKKTSLNGKLISTEEAKKVFAVNRIAQSGVQVKYIKQ